MLLGLCRRKGLRVLATAALYASNMASYTASVVTLFVLISILSPTIARHARGLRANFKDSVRNIGRRFGSVSISATLLSIMVILPAYGGSLLNVWGMYGGLRQSAHYRIPHMQPGYAGHVPGHH